MKKIVLIFVLVISVFFFSACTTHNLNKLVMNNMSDIRYAIYDGQTEELAASYVYGLREKTFEYNGKATEPVPFGIVSVIFKNSVNYTTVDFEFEADGEVVSGKLEKNPFTEEYMVDLEKIYMPEEITLKVQGETIITVTMLIKSKDWEIQYEEALNIGIKELEDELNKNVSAGKLNAECYLKIINDVHNTLDKYFWFFSFITTDMKTYSCIIDPMTGNVLVKS